MTERGFTNLLADVGLPDCVEFELLQHHPGQRCCFAARASGRRYVVKAFSVDPAPVAALYRRLDEEGLAGASPPAVPRLAFYSSELRLLANDWLPGPSGADLINQGRGARAGELAATWLRCSAAIEIDFGRVFDPREALGDVEDVAGALAVADAELGEVAAGVVSVLGNRTPAFRPATLRHGSYYGRHVLDLGEGPGVIDWDGFRQGPIELDAGNLLAWLSRRAGGSPRQAPAVAETGEAFTQGIAGLVDPAAVAWFRVGALVKLAKYLSGRRPVRWRDRAAALLDEAGQMLERAQ